jgi:hypothetical protein
MKKITFIHQLKTENMKMILVLSFLATSTLAMAQKEAIQLVNFEQKIRVNTAELNEKEWVQVKSSCAGEVSVSFEDKRFSGGCAGALERTYTFSDQCGNTLEKKQYITLEDTTPPVFPHLPEAEVILEKREDFNKAFGLFATDDSGDYPDSTVEETYDFDDPEFVHIYRVFTAKDACDNTTTFEQKVSIKRPNREEANER